MGICFLIKLKEDDGMRKMLSAALLMCIVALLSTLSVPVVHATPPTPASGTETYTPHITGMRFADGNTFLDVTSDDFWTGTFVGHSHSVYRAVIYSSGFWYGEGLTTFEYCTVAGKSGTLVMVMVGKKSAVYPFWWSGKWVILSGTGDLANLRGQGTWWGPGAPAPGVEGSVSYSGKIHFEPD